eukprot:2546301-Rhodomonas_salina.2
MSPSGYNCTRVLSGSESPESYLACPPLPRPGHWHTHRGTAAGGVTHAFPQPAAVTVLVQY